MADYTQYYHYTAAGIYTMADYTQYYHDRLYTNHYTPVTITA